MKKLLRVLAVLVALGGLAFWLAAGANAGWTKNRVEKKTLDEITGIEAISYEDKFIPGIDFLGGSFVGATALLGVSFFFRNKSKLAA